MSLVHLVPLGSRSLVSLFFLLRRLREILYILGGICMRPLCFGCTGLYKTLYCVVYFFNLRRIDTRSDIVRVEMVFWV